MTPNEYMRTVLEHASSDYRSVAPGLQHGVIGLMSEVGELADCLKKMHFHPNKPISDNKIVDEVGDCLWYIALILKSLGYSFEEAMDMNKAKLDHRYNKNGGEKDYTGEAMAQLGAYARPLGVDVPQLRAAVARPVPHPHWNPQQDEPPIFGGGQGQAVAAQPNVTQPAGGVNWFDHIPGNGDAIER